MADPLPLDVLTRVINVQWGDRSVTASWGWSHSVGGYPMVFLPQTPFGVSTEGWTVSGVPSTPTTVTDPGDGSFLPTIFPDGQGSTVSGPGSAAFTIWAIYNDPPPPGVRDTGLTTTVTWGDFTATNDETGEVWVVDFVSATGGSAEALSSIGVLVVFRPGP